MAVGLLPQGSGASVLIIFYFLLNTIFCIEFNIPQFSFFRERKVFPKFTSPGLMLRKLSELDAKIGFLFSLPFNLQAQ